MSLDAAIKDVAIAAEQLESDVAEVKGRQTRIEVQWLQVQSELREGQKRIEATLKELVAAVKGNGHG